MGLYSKFGAVIPSQVYICVSELYIQVIKKIVQKVLLRFAFYKWVSSYDETEILKPKIDCIKETSDLYSNDGKQSQEFNTKEGKFLKFD